VPQNRTKHLAIATVLLLLAGVAGVAWCLHGYPVHHFAVVQPGVLYRGGQVDEDSLEELVDRYQVRTVINLRGREDQADWYVEEQDFCRRHALRLVSIPIGEPGKARDGLREFLDIMRDPASYPVFVHCEAGSCRTGFAVAAYRIVMQGWSCRAALQEAQDLRFNLEATTQQEYVRILEELAKGADWSRPPDSPDSRGAVAGPESRPASSCEY